MKILITGGHFSPAHSVIQILRKENEVIVVGRKYAFEGDKNESYEYKYCRDEGIAFINLETARLQRKLTRNTLPSLSRFPKAIINAIKIIKQTDPDIVLTFGGYLGLPISIASKMLRIPIILHEQTQKAGMSARIIGKIADAVLITFESSRPYFKNKNIILTGNPLRNELFEDFDIEEFTTEKPKIYITGGSTGSHVINKVIGHILPSLLEDFAVFHQTGNSQEFNDLEKSKIIFENLPHNLRANYIFKDFFNVQEASYLIKNSSLVISRSGINTVLELIALKSPAILIPLPYGQTNEQLDNALFFVNNGLGEYILQKELTGQLLLQKIHAMIKDRNEYLINFDKAQKFINKNSAKLIVEQIYHYGRKRGTGTEGRAS